MCVFIGLSPLHERDSINSNLLSNTKWRIKKTGSLQVLAHCRLLLSRLGIAYDFMNSNFMY